jgi:hypothetical protein
MFESLRKRSAITALKKVVADQKRMRKILTLDKAASCAIVFDATGEKTRREVLDWAKELEKKGKKVTLLGFYDEKKPPSPAPEFEFFFAKETAWNHEQKSEKAAAFLKKDTDVLLCINPNNCLPVTWVAAQHKAAMKIGMATELPNDLDLQIETPADKGIPFFAQELKHYSDRIK